MHRRNFLKSIGATALLPSIPLPATALATPTATAAAAPAFSAHTYQWAEMIVRAHNKCNLGLLQRSLRIDETAAIALKESLIKNGIVSAQANAFGIHKAVKPLYEGAFVNVSETSAKVKEAAEKISEIVDDLSEPDQENESDINVLPDDNESEFEDDIPDNKTETGLNEQDELN